MTDLEISQTFLVHQAVFKCVFEVSNLFMCLPQGYAWFTVMFHSTFEVWRMAKLARELKMRSKTVSCVTTLAPNDERQSCKSKVV